MKRICIYVALSLLISTSQAQTFQRTENGIKTTVAVPNVNVEIQWFTPGSLRVLKTPQGQNVEKKSLSVIAQPAKTDLRVTSSGDGLITMKSQSLTVTLDTKNGTLTYAKPDGSILLKELKNDRPFTKTNDAGRQTYIVYQGFQTDKEEGLYGLGQLQNGKMMQRNMTKVLAQGNVEDVSPIFQSTKGYGVYWDN